MNAQLLQIPENSPEFDAAYAEQMQREWRAQVRAEWRAKARQKIDDWRMERPDVLEHGEGGQGSSESASEGSQPFSGFEVELETCIVGQAQYFRLFKPQRPPKKGLRLDTRFQEQEKTIINDLCNIMREETYTRCQDDFAYFNNRAGLELGKIDPKRCETVIKENYERTWGIIQEFCMFEDDDARLVKDIIYTAHYIDWMMCVFGMGTLKHINEFKSLKGGLTGGSTDGASNAASSGPTSSKVTFDDISSSPEEAGFSSGEGSTTF